ncbi:arylsulfatase A-like enzyme [Microbacterium sp. AG1240]|uniref:sulfatase-like hydrolase/transferase n=1 Tax=Microbacterium sp. AG1240 TaxID=2183992 RepID=UPI000EAC398B|nr:sulfatase-like hydrolase/transferase [Microbacterium sp. AG1240]RKT35688.1 arylsulfatase A-like enzyme [Microbacterium sp. AG1240]
MRAIVLMFDSLNRRMVPPFVDAAPADLPQFRRLASRSVAFDRFYAGSMPCMPARREMHTGRHNFLHRGWGPLEPFDDSAPEILGKNGVHTHLASDHVHYWEDGGATYHTRFSTWEFLRGQEGDPWKGVVGAHDIRLPPPQRMRTQDEVNRRHMATEATHSQTRTVDAGLEFLETNAEADSWMLQIELFDPHEPFFASERFRSARGLDPNASSDWPAYRKVLEDDNHVERVRDEYLALLDQCDHSLGRVLDAMDAHEMWDDTMLIVNTDHGFLLGEHGWWAKGVMPWFNELVHVPMYLWDPRERRAGERDERLAQTIDIPSTLLDFFGVRRPDDMQGLPLTADAPVHDGALFGVHGGHVNVTDGRFVYMRAAEDASNRPLEEYTLMPTRMRARFSVDELASWEPAEAFSFTKGLRTLRVDSPTGWLNSWGHGTMLFDLATDPAQLDPVVDDQTELRMAQLLVDLMRRNDAPASQFTRLGLPAAGEAEHVHLRARADRERALSIAEPLPRESDLAARDLLTLPLADVLSEPARREVVARYAPDLVHTEMIGLGRGASILTIAGRAGISAQTLRDLDRDLDAARRRASRDDGTGAP